MLSAHKSYHEKYLNQKGEVDELRKKSQNKKSQSDGLTQPKLFGGVGKSLQV